MKKNLFFGFLLFCILAIGCKKDKKNGPQEYVSGQIIDQLSLKGVPGALVELWERDFGGSTLLSSQTRKLGETIADDSGYYQIPFEGCSLYMKQKIIVAFKEHYYRTTDVMGKLINCSNNKGTIFALTPASYIKLQVKNVNPQNENDSIFLSLNYPLELKGMNIDTTLYFMIQSNSSRFFYWDVTKNGQTQPRVGGFVFCQTPFDTCFYNILY